MMVVVKQKNTKVDENFTIYKRIVKLNDGSKMYQLQVSTDKNFKVYTSITFASLKSANEIYKQRVTF